MERSLLGAWPLVKGERTGWRRLFWRFLVWTNVESLLILKIGMDRLEADNAGGRPDIAHLMRLKMSNQSSPRMIFFFESWRMALDRKSTLFIVVISESLRFKMTRKSSDTIGETMVIQERNHTSVSRKARR